MSRTPEFDEAYPQQLWEYERAFLPPRPDGTPAGDRPPDDVLGVALSGGGIRSATFCLGFFQSLARLDLLGRIGYLSTVSGGGYFGSFLGRLYSRRELDSRDVRRLLDPETGKRDTPKAVPDVIRWLRENGRYLSPNGAGDLLLGGAISFRNWVTIHVVLLSFVLFALVTGQLLRLGFEAWAAHTPALAAFAACQGAACKPAWLWGSPWLYVSVAMFAFWATPLGWAYWLTGRWRGRPVIEWPAWGVLAAVALALGGIAFGVQHGAAAYLQQGAMTVLVAAIALACWGLARGQARKTAAGESQRFRSEESRELYQIDEQRNSLSWWLKAALVTTLGALAFAVLDSAGQTFYLVASQPDRRLFALLFSALSGLAGSAAFARRLATASGGQPTGRRLGLPMSAVALLVALAIFGVLLIAMSVLSHAVAWGFQTPCGAPEISWARPAEPAPVVATNAPCFRPPAAWQLTAAVWVVSLLFGILFGRSWPFLNQSSLQSLYGARLTRAYLGASNPLRRERGKEAITRVRPGDNVDPVDYWALAEDRRRGPIHLINVTINETMDGQSQVQQQDRKGTGLALGPCALSVGVKHHAVFASHAALFADGLAGRTARCSPPVPTADRRPTRCSRASRPATGRGASGCPSGRGSASPVRRSRPASARGRASA